MTKIKIPNERDLLSIKEFLFYNSETGIIVWKKSKSGVTSLKSNAGCIHGGYRRIKINGNRYMAHRIAWYLFYNKWPNYEIDHINGNKLDNRICNLRDVLKNQNQQNKPVHRNGQEIGITKHKGNPKWIAQAPNKFLNRNAKRSKYLGSFKTKEEAIDAVIKYCTENLD
tara:strand:- start:3230 stop:3736 length:507 start_codon:yes stop_codon:yes gene_type:complete